MALRGFLAENIKYISGFVIVLIITVLTEYSQYKIYTTFVHALTIPAFLFFLYKMLINFEDYRYLHKRYRFKWVRQYNPEQYDTLKRWTTLKEKEKLLENPKFIEMLNEKGGDEANWNWQLRDRLRGRLNNLSDNDLSNIDVSESEDDFS
jgi:uncharacterized protein YjiS (DUF1127 family)